MLFKGLHYIYIAGNFLSDTLSTLNTTLLSGVIVSSVTWADCVYVPGWCDVCGHDNLFQIVERKPNRLVLVSLQTTIQFYDQVHPTAFRSGSDVLLQLCQCLIDVTMFIEETLIRLLWRTYKVNNRPRVKGLGKWRGHGADGKGPWADVKGMGQVARSWGMCQGHGTYVKVMGACMSRSWGGIYVKVMRRQVCQSDGAYMSRSWGIYVKFMGHIWQGHGAYMARARGRRHGQMATVRWQGPGEDVKGRPYAQQIPS